MKKIISIALLVVTSHALAQPEYVERIGFKLESIADIDIGWMKIYKQTTTPKGKQLGNRIYSAKQIGYSHQFMEWMQQSYLPKGCLGEVRYYQNAIPQFNSTNSRLGNEINTHAHALPHLYGAYSKMYMFLKKDAQGKFVPQNNLAEYWHIEANQLQYISSPVSFISSPNEYYFLLPDFSSHSKGYEDDDKVSANLMGFTSHHNIAAYRHFYIPPKIISDDGFYVVIMTKDNQLPFEKITIGEFFTAVEKQFPAWQKLDPITPENYATALKNLARLKEKYKTQWNEVAELKLSDAAIDLYDFVNATQGNDDMFDNKDMYGKQGVYTTFPVMKVKRPSLELCKTDQPQWLVIRWTAGMKSQPYYIHMHESILNNFNFDYVYNYFFDPGKIKGQSYKPLRAPDYKEAAVITGESEASKRYRADRSIFYFEDFSTSAAGKKPNGWNSKLNTVGLPCLVKTIEGTPGNWAEIKGNEAFTPVTLNKPFPQNFTISYDVLVPKDFTWGGKALAFQLSKETAPGNAESFLKLKLRPGYDGRDGEAELETKFSSPPGYSTGTKWYKAPGFSNDKKYNRINVTIKKWEESLQVFIDNNKIAGYEKALPAALLFNALSFTHGRSDGDTEKYYISNIRITKD